MIQRIPSPVVMACVLVMITAVASAAPHGLRAFEDEPPAPELGLPDMTGRHHHLADYRGQVLVVNFWATWCTPCREELPAMSRTAEALHPSGVRFVTVAMGQTEAELRDFLRLQELPLPKLYDADSTVSERWSVQALPTTWVVDPAGRIALRVVGNYDWESEEIMQAIARLLPQGTGAER